MSDFNPIADIIKSHEERPSVVKQHDYRVTMHNALVSARHGLSLPEKRIVALALSKNDSQNSSIPRNSTKITAQEYAETFDVTTDAAYLALREATERLWQREIIFFEPAGKRRGKGKEIKDTVVKSRWVKQVKYQEGEGWIGLTWVEEIMPLLVGLKKDFTTYRLKQVSALRSVYSWRLFELLMRFAKKKGPKKGEGIARYDIDDFCEAMEATEKQRSNFANIRRRIIEPAVTELRDKDGWDIDWKPIKAGRKVKSLEFRFAPRAQASLPFDEPDSRKIRSDKGIKKIWDECDIESIQDAHEALSYVRFFDCIRNEKLEPIILKDDWVAVQYAVSVLRDRWREAESKLSDPAAIAHYCVEFDLLFENHDDGFRPIPNFFKKRYLAKSKSQRQKDLEESIKADLEAEEAIWAAETEGEVWATEKESDPEG